MLKLIDLAGKRFGILTVIEQVEKRNKNGQIIWLCKCSCGKEVLVLGHLLRKYRTRSCGCLRAEISSIGNRTHGRSKDRVYRTYHTMLKRCLDKMHKQYKGYGGRGITVCDRWRESFENFFEDMGIPPTDKHQIDRINNNGNYEPNNCRWVTNKENCRNKRNCKMLSYRGITKSLPEWAEDANILRSTLYARLYRSNWSIEKALNTPVITPNKGSSK
jgi:hypothetical protein